MMKLKITEIGKALHPAEVVVAVRTLTGTENLVVDRASINGGYLGVGFPIRESNGRFLVELPTESQSGAWRVWVSGDQVSEPQKMSA